MTTAMMRIVVDKSADHAKPHCNLLFTIMSTSKKMVFFRARVETALRDTLTPAALSALLSTTAN